MSRQLPPRPSLASLKRQAKQLLRALLSGDPDASSRLVAFHPRAAFVAERGPSLSDAQLAIAREYGFPSWPRLQAAVRQLSGDAADRVIDAPERVMAAWLTERLRLRGYLGDDGTVESVDREVPFRGKPAVQRLRLTYAGETTRQLPRTFIYKHNTKGSRKARVKGHCAGVREALLYRDLFTQMPHYPVARCFDLGIDPERGHSYLVLEDLSETHDLLPASERPSPYGGWLCFDNLPAETFLQATDRLAEFHAAWWDHETISQPPFCATTDDLFSIIDTADADSVPARLADLSSVAGKLGPVLAEVTKKAIETAPTLARDRLARRRNLTLAHNDFHLRNVLVPRGTGGELVVFDWEGAATGVGMLDLAHLMISSMLPVEMRSRLEEAAIARYCDVLEQQGVAGYTASQAKEDYRLAIVVLMSQMCKVPPFLRAAEAAFHAWTCEGLLTQGGGR